MKYEKSCGCIIINDNKVLLVQQNDGHWGFPKGHMEENETEIQTAIREVKEETNLDVKIEEKRRYVNTYMCREDTTKDVILFLATPTNSDIKPQEEEIKKIEWFDMDKAIERITYDNTKTILRQVKNEYNCK